MLWDERSRRSKIDIANKDREDRQGQGYKEAYNFLAIVHQDHTRVVWYSRLQISKDSNGSQLTTSNVDRSWDKHHRLSEIY